MSNSLKKPFLLQHHRSRVLLGLVCLCLLLLGIKAIYHAMQPNYQGKTAEEWFNEAKVIHTIHDIRVVPYDPAALALTHLDTNAVWYLWREYARKDSRFTVRVMDTWRYYILHEDISYTDYLAEKRDRAAILLLEMRPAAACLIPELVSRVDGADVEKSMVAAHWLGLFHLLPGQSVPALCRALEQTSRIPAHERFEYIAALGAFGKAAESALPLLLKLYDEPKTSQGDRQNLAAAIVRIDCESEHPQYLSRVLDQNDLQKSADVLGFPAREGLIQPHAVPALRQLAESYTNELHVALIEGAIRDIEAHWSSQVHKKNP